MKVGFLPIDIKLVNWINYYEALDKAHTQKDYDDFIRLVAKEVEDSLDSLDLYLGAFE